MENYNFPRFQGGPNMGGGGGGGLQFCSLSIAFGGAIHSLPTVILRRLRVST